MALRTFTPAEANSALPQVRPVAERMVALRRRLAELEGEQREVVKIIAGNGSGYAVGESRSPAYTAAMRELEACVEELDELGVEVKDVESGLLDFPALRNGERVFLCWRLGEDAVTHWHDLEEGFAGRKEIDWE